MGRNDMAYQVDWYEEGAVIYLKLFDEVTVEELERATAITMAMSRQYPERRLHNIMDLRVVRDYPMAIAELQSVFSRLDSRHSMRESGWTIMVGAENSALRFVLSTMGQLFQFKFRMFDSLEDGLRFLNEVDDSLPALLPVKVASLR